MKKLTFTKIIVISYSVLFAIWVSLSYVLAFLGHDEIAQDLSGQVVIVGIAAILGYMLKAFFETREIEKNKLDREFFNIKSSEEDSDESVE